MVALQDWLRERMAFVRRGIGDSDSDIDSSRRSTGSSGFVAWFALPCATIACATWLVAALAGVHATASLAHTGSLVQASLPMQSQRFEMPRQLALNTKARLSAPVEKSARPITHAVTAKPKVAPVAKIPVDPFGKVIAEAKLSREKLVAAFARAGIVIAEAEDPVEVAFAMPTAERFHRPADSAPSPSQRLASQPDHAAADVAPAPVLGPDGAEIRLAYVSVEAGWDNPIELALASFGDDPFGMNSDVGGDDEETPAIALAPPGRPVSASPKDKPKAAPEPPVQKPARAPKPESDAKPEPKALAFARPDKPGVGAFKNLFNTPKAGKGVAIYDISSATVHMPDGSKLRAHSGIGKMADNPRYVHVKMNGPTPPNTYRLSMREKRFHGVEAIRMTPIGEQTMHGRDGILAHSFLLRGGRPESHGCVAFANYPKFLKAFKQGKVTHMIVVPSMSRMPKVQLASTGRGA
jgi:hypothetical protein